MTGLAFQFEFVDCKTGESRAIAFLQLEVTAVPDNNDIEAIFTWRGSVAAARLA